MLLNELFEVSLGSYLNKASMSRGQAQMGARFGRDAEQRARDLATFNKRDRGMTRARSRVEKQRQADLQNQMADTIAKLPKLKDEYARMQQRYHALGGSNWQYADREQNLSNSEREARALEGPMNNLWRQIQAAEKAQSQQGVAEMDKSQKGAPGWNISDNPGGKEYSGKPAKTKDVVKSAGKELDKAFSKAHPDYSKHEKKLISKMSDDDKVKKGWRNPNL